MAGALIAAVVIRFGAACEHLWLDELHTSWVVNGYLGQVAHRATMGNQSPLYFWLVWPIVNSFGMDALSLRFLSLATGILLVIGCTWVTWRWTRSLLATVSVSWILAFDPLMVFYASEARPYAMVQLIGLVQIFLFWKYWKAEWDQRKHSTLVTSGLILVSVLLFYTHYTSSLIFLAEAMFVLASVLTSAVWKFFSVDTIGSSNRPNAKWASMLLRMALRMGRRMGRRMGPLVLFVVILLGPAFANLQLIWDRKQQWTGVSSVEQMWAELSPSWMILILLPGLAVGAILLLHRIRFKADEAVVDSLLPFLAMCAMGPAFLAIIADHFHLAPLALSRYVVVGQVAAILFVGAAVGRCKSNSQRLVLSVLVLGLMAWQNPVFTHLVARHSLPRFRHENWQEPIEQINRMSEYGHLPVFQFANILEDAGSQTNLNPEFQDYLLFPLRGLYAVDERERQLIPMPTLASQPFSEPQVQYAKGQGGAWLIIRASKTHAYQISNAFKNKAGSELTWDEFSSPDNDVTLMLARFR